HVDLRRRDDAPDRVLHLREDPLGLLETRADRRPHVQADRARLNAREEVLSEVRHEERGAAGEEHEPAEHDPSVLEPPGEEYAVAVPQAGEPSHERGVETGAEPPPPRLRRRRLLALHGHTPVPRRLVPE